MEIEAPGRILPGISRANTVFGAHGDRSAASIVSHILTDAIRCGASDIHIDPTENETIGRLRIDGELLEEFRIAGAIHAEIISRIKVLAHLRSDEHQRPQDGRFRFALPDKSWIDVRVSIAPTYWGENAVLRLLVHKQELGLEELSFSEADRTKITAALARPHGMILVTGPTGSGKTTTLYALITALNTAGVSIVTIEDPVEYAIAQIVQMQIKPERGFTFGSGLRAMVRQDPDIIMVGEIRDTETAALAINTALTGHLLLSTLHTNDAATTLPRLLDMNIDAYLIASTVTIVIAQRLVRRICEACKIEQPMTEAELERLRPSFPGLDAMQFWKGRGCALCNETGYRGRLAIAEVLVVDDAVREAILRKSSAATITDIARRSGMQTMGEDGFAKADRGLTTISEVLRSVNR